MTKSNIYTRKGDAGSTSLVGGRTVAKTDARLEAYGTVDELNAAIGVLLSLMDSTDEEARLLRHVQNCLFVIGTSLATDLDSTPLSDAGRLDAGEVEIMERHIDTLDAALPPLRRFVLPGGTTAAACAHMCRTVCRRAERRICSLATEHEVAANVREYINRLSDYFFVLARYLNHAESQPELSWGGE